MSAPAVTGATGEPPQPDDCTCNTITGAETIRVHPGAAGHVVIRQVNVYDDDDVVLVLPHQIPRLVKMLERVAGEVKEIGDACPAHDEPEAS